MIPPPKIGKKTKNEQMRSLGNADRPSCGPSDIDAQSEFPAQFGTMYVSSDIEDD